ncbi:MAG: Na/Pi cotransporter family protein [Prolixibacteraceae bacterium]|nr:Na/Pi cotransporter family protein [Prolixibacteraceae bacterium]
MIELAIVSFLAGLGLFFFGLQTLTHYLKILTGKKVRKLIVRFTKTAAHGIFLGGILITVTQSLSAMVFTLIGMARAKAIEVKQALPIIIGGNILGGVIIFLISFDIEVVILLVLGLSAILLTSTKSKKYINYFGLIFGLALLFFGLFTMQSGVSPLIEMPWMQEALISSQGKYIAVFVIAALISLIIHSTMATIIIGLALTSSGLLSFHDAMMLVYGANVGSSVLTFILSAKITGKSKQIAMFQGFYNFIGALLVLPLFVLEVYGEIPLVGALVHSLSANLAVQMALLYTIFNIIPGFLLLATLPIVGRLLNRFWPESLEEKLAAPRFIYNNITDDSESALQLLKLEQANLLNLISATFNLLRHKEGHSKMASYIEGFQSLNTTINETITEISASSKLNFEQYEALNQSITIQSKLKTLFGNIVALSDNYRVLSKAGHGEQFITSSIEGLDVILMTLQDVVNQNNNEDADLLQLMTSEDGNGIKKVRKAYLSHENKLNADEKLNLLETMNRCERIIRLMGELGKEFVKSSSIK